MPLHRLPLWAKSNKRKYSSLKSFLTVFFSQDSDVFSENTEQVMDSYFDYVHDYDEWTTLDAQISMVLDIHDDVVLKGVMLELAENQIDPALNDMTWRAFLTELKHHVDSKLLRR